MNLHAISNWDDGAVKKFPMVHVFIIVTGCVISREKLHDARIISNAVNFGLLYPLNAITVVPRSLARRPCHVNLEVVNLHLKSLLSIQCKLQVLHDL